MFCLGVILKPILFRDAKDKKEVGIRELPRLDFQQFQHDFPSFSDKKRLLLGGRGANCSVGGRVGPEIYTCLYLIVYIEQGITYA